MRRIEYQRYGGPEEMHLVETEPKSPRSNEIRVRVQAASTNPMDWKIRDGAVKIMTGRSFPRGVGTDFAGVVEALGAGVTRFKVGDSVFGAMTMKASASFADTIVTAEDTAAIKPAGISFEEASTLPIAGATAWEGLLVAGNLQRGQRVFVNGCLGSVGRAAVQLAKIHGARVSGTCSADGVDEALALGVENPLDYRTFEPGIGGARFDVVLDTAGTLSPGDCRAMLTPKGVAVHIAPKSIFRVLFARRNKIAFAKLPVGRLETLGKLAAEGRLTLQIGATVPLSEAVATITKLETTGQPRGKTVVVPH